jgi:hypothetical protein
VAAASVNALDALRTLKRALSGKRTDAVPAEWRTVHQWSAEWSYSRPRTSAIIRQATDEGLMEMRLFVIQTGQVTRRTPHYRMKGK